MTSSTPPTRSTFRIKYQYIVWLTRYWKRKKEKPDLCQSFLCRCLHNKIFTEFFDYVQFLLFFLPLHTLKFNLLKVDFCLNTFHSLCKPESQAVLYTSRCFLFSSPFSTVRDAASFTASRPQDVFAFTSRLQRHTSRCYNQVSSHCQVLQGTGYWTRTVAAFLCVTSIGPERLQAPGYANIWRALRWSSFHNISRWRRVGHSRHQTTRVTKTEALLWRVEVGRTNRTLTEQNKHTNLWQLKTIKPLEGPTWTFLSSLIAIALSLSVSLSLLHSSDPSPSPHTPPLSTQAVFAFIGRWNLCVHTIIFCCVESAMSILSPEDPGGDPSLRSRPATQPTAGTLSSPNRITCTICTFSWVQSRPSTGSCINNCQVMSKANNRHINQIDSSD